MRRVNWRAECPAVFAPRACARRSSRPFQFEFRTINLIANSIGELTPFQFLYIEVGILIAKNAIRVFVFRRICFCNIYPISDFVHGADGYVIFKYYLTIKGRCVQLQLFSHQLWIEINNKCTFIYYLRCRPFYIQFV